VSAGRTLKMLAGKDASKRVLIVQRVDGAFTYRHEVLVADGEASVGPDCGIYDSAETAEAEARSRVSDLNEVFG
jgi:hypothetical protein